MMKFTQKMTDITDELCKDYAEGTSAAELARKYSICRLSVRRCLEESGIAIRGRADANRIMMNTRSPDDNRRNSEAAHRASKGRKHTYKERVTHALAIEKRLSHGSPAELLLTEWLIRRNIGVIPQKAIGPYNADIAIPDSHTIIEVNGGGWHASPQHVRLSDKKFRHITSHGWRVIVIWIDNRRYPMIEQDLLQSITGFLDEEMDKYMVLRANGIVCALGSDDLTVLSKHPRIYLG